MKTILPLIATCLFLTPGWSADLKVATVDLQRALADYHRSQEAARALKEREGSFLKEMEGLRLEGRRLVNEVEDLRRLSLDNVLSASEREQKKKEFELKLTDLRAFELKYDDTRSQKAAELQNQAARVHRDLLLEVISATRNLADKEGFNLVLNASQANPASGGVLYSRNIEDVTGKVVAVLNAAQPAIKREPEDKTIPKPE